MSSTERDKTLALAALFQAAQCAAELARTGECNSEAYEALLQSALVMDTDDVAKIYPKTASLRTGLTALEACLSQQGQGLQQAGEVVRIALAILQVDKHLLANGGVQQALRQGLERVQRQVTIQPDTSLAQQRDLLAQTYVDSLGTLRYRVQIRGNPDQLQSVGMAEKIRAVLLAGVRAAWLWRRLGGRRWHLLFSRGRILSDIRELARTV